MSHFSQRLNPLITRRRFLLIGSTALAAGTAFASPLMHIAHRVAQSRVAVVGLGRRGRQITAALLASGASRVAVFDPDLSKAGEAERHLGESILAKYSSLDRLLSEYIPDLAYVAAPDVAHGPLVEGIMARGSTAVVEMPMPADLVFSGADLSQKCRFRVIDSLGSDIRRAWDLSPVRGQRVNSVRVSYLRRRPNLSELAPVREASSDKSNKRNWRLWRESCSGGFASEAHGALAFALEILPSVAGAEVDVLTQHAFLAPFQTFSREELLPDQIDAYIEHPDGWTLQCEQRSELLPGVWNDRVTIRVRTAEGGVFSHITDCGRIDLTSPRCPRTSDFLALKLASEMYSS